MRRHPGLLPLFLVAGSLLLPGSAHAFRCLPWWEAPDGPPSDAQLYGGDEDFLEATVVAVRDSGATNGNPPTVTLDVRHVFRGRFAVGRLVIAWPGYPLFLLCGVGAAAEERAWAASPLHGPPVGQRLVLGGNLGPDRVWQADPCLRWTDAEASAERVREKIRAWTPRIAERRRQDALRAEHAQAQARADRARSEDDLRRTEEARFERERALRERADLDQLVRMSDAVFVAPPPSAAAPVGSWGRYVRFRPRLRLLDAGRPGAALVVFGAREDSLFARWQRMPKDEKAGSGAGDSTGWLVFLRLLHDPGNAADALFRPADPVFGILWADSASVRVVRGAIARRGRDPIQPVSACGAGFGEFVTSDSIAAESIALKLTRRGGSTLILDGRVRSGYLDTEGPDAGWFAPCAFADSEYAPDFRNARSIRIGGSKMRALIDSLAAIPRVAAGRAESADSMALSLRRIVDGRERVFEATLDASAREAVCRAMAAVFPEQAFVRWNVPQFWAEADPRLYRIWNPLPPSHVVEVRQPMAPLTPLPASPGHGTVVGIVSDKASGAPVFLATVRTTDPMRVAHTDEEGVFALADLPTGRRWVQVYAPNYEMRYEILDVAGERPDPVVYRLLAHGYVNASAIVRRDLAPTWDVSPRVGAALVIHVRDDAGKAVPRAWIRIARDGWSASASADDAGAATFDAVEPGSYLVVAHADGFAPGVLRLIFRAGAPEDLALALSPGARPDGSRP